MSSCRQTDSLRSAVLAGEITRADASHLADCAQCARELAHLRRFDRSLAHVVREMAPEPLPPAADGVGISPMRVGGRLGSGRRAALVGGSLIVAAAVALAGGGDWIRSSVGAFFQQDAQINVEGLQSWMDRAFGEVVAETGRPADPAEWEPAQVETCGRTAIAFWMEQGGQGVRAYRWAIGDPMNRLVAVHAGGLAGSLTDPNVARLRAGLPVCDVVSDATPGSRETLAALDAAREAWEREWHGWAGRGPIPGTGELLRSRVIDVSRGTPRDMWVLLERPDHGSLDRVAISVDGAEFRVEGSSGDGEMIEPFVVHAEPGPDYWVYYASVADGSVRAVELIGPSGALRYSIRSPGFILDIDVDPAEISAYRFVDAQGVVIATGNLDLPCGSDHEFFVREGFFAQGRREVFCIPDR